MKPLNIAITDLTLDTIIEGGYEGSQTLGNAIINRAVERMTKAGEYSEVSSGLRKRVAQIRDEEIRNLVNLELAKAMTEPVIRTNSYGEATGEPTTLRALIIEHAKDFFTKKVSSGNYGRGPETTSAQRVIADMIKETMTKELAAVFSEEKSRVVKAIQANAAEVIADAVRKGLR